MKGFKRHTDKFLPVAFIVFLIVVWQLTVDLLGVEKFVLPSPTDVIKVLISDFDVIWPHAVTTLYEGVIGFVIAIILALVLAVTMDLVPIAKKAIYPIFVISQTIPVIALAPLFTIWFGFGSLPKVVVVVIMCFFPIVISISDGLEGVDKDLINHFKLMGASKIQRFIHLKLPYGLINFFSGMRIAATYCIMGAVVGEWMGGQIGLGVYMTRARSSYAIDKMFAAIIIIILMSIALFWIIGLISKVVQPWKRIER